MRTAVGIILREVVVGDAAGDDADRFVGGVRIAVEPALCGFGLRTGRSRRAACCTLRANCPASAPTGAFGRGRSIRSRRGRRRLRPRPANGPCGSSDASVREYGTSPRSRRPPAPCRRPLAGSKVRRSARGRTGRKSASPARSATSASKGRRPRPRPARRWRRSSPN